ncbi:MAG: NAD(P)-dependent oxidoreductase [Phenylobacterium sp.]|jgi:precorrin-2 dehydrogenase/sirohydrochlorin ferrochelatase|uniref:NAD(P)-dependent oxidoreductase n=1 Tax=Phenylobacterium sp. TaxID=1871053 RepID=UPI002A371FB8|nr:NAD(P)-dependent oxidoreductase [Phenylobacterium sp.]MDX9996620.1 NAD(P)-dependent oxidoreductase [Phenylobacterium sp.]
MDAFPAYFPLSGKKVVIAGSGEAAEAKARLFEGSPARVVRLEGPPATNPHAYIGARLAFIASGDEQFLEQALKAARSAGALVNVPDRPDLCDFTTPAVIDRGGVVAAVGTGGASPMLATLLRGDIEARVPEGAGRVAALFQKFQQQVREALPEPHRRRTFLREALLSPAAEAAAAGDMDKAARLFLEALAKGPAGLGRVVFVDGRGPADLLTLRAARALAAADVLAPDAAVDADVMALARRDTERLAPAEADSERLAALAAEGRRVVRIVTGEPGAEELERLAAAGVTVERAPVAEAR